MINYNITLTFRLLHDRQGREVDQFDEESTRLGFRSVHHNSKLSVADPDPGSGAFLTPGSGTSKKSGSGSGMNNPESYFLELRNHFFLA